MPTEEKKKKKKKEKKTQSGIYLYRIPMHREMPRAKSLSRIGLLQDNHK